MTRRSRAGTSRRSCGRGSRRGARRRSQPAADAPRPQHDDNRRHAPGSSIWRAGPAGRRRRPARVALRAEASRPTARASAARAAPWTRSAASAASGCRRSTLALRPAEGQLQLDTLLVRSNVAVDRWRRAPRAPAGRRSGQAHARGDAGRPRARSRRSWAPTRSAFDSARVNLAVTGPAWHWRLDGGADAYGVAFGGNLANRVTLAGAATLDSTRVSAVSGDLRVKDAAYGQLTLRELTAAGGYDSTLALDLKLNIGDSVASPPGSAGPSPAPATRCARSSQRLTLDEGGRAWALERPASLRASARAWRSTAWRSAPARGASRVERGVRPARFERPDPRASRRSTSRRCARRAWSRSAAGSTARSTSRGRPTAPRLQGRMGLAILSSAASEIGTLASDVDWTAAGLRIAAAATPHARRRAHRRQARCRTGSPSRPRDTAAAAGSRARTRPTPSRWRCAPTASTWPCSSRCSRPDVARGLHGRLQADARIGGTIRTPAGDRHRRA